MERFLTFMMRRRILIPMSVLLAALMEWTFNPGCPHKLLHITIVSLFAAGMWLFPKIPPDDMRGKP